MRCRQEACPTIVTWNGTSTLTRNHARSNSEENMRTFFPTKLTALFLVSVAATVVTSAQNSTQKQNENQAPPRYRLVDLGTFGGPASYFSNGSDGILNTHGTAVGWANTTEPDPTC